MLATGLVGHTAFAQQQSEEIIVTGSRITNTSGMETPVPVTVVTPAELSVLAPTNLIEGLSELPQFYSSATTQNPSAFFTSTGAGSLDLRGLQSKRTLQLLDGRRVVPSTIFGGPDINLFPENVVRSVETVTGGASAAYGTDAVAGVVNFVLDKQLKGIKANVQYGANSKGDNSTYKVSAGGGFDAGQKTHILFNVEKERQDPIWGADVAKYDWYQNRGLINNPAAGAGSSQANPFYIAVNDIRALGYDMDGIFYLPTAAAPRSSIRTAPRHRTCAVIPAARRVVPLPMAVPVTTANLARSLQCRIQVERTRSCTSRTTSRISSASTAS